MVLIIFSYYWTREDNALENSPLVGTWQISHPPYPSNPEEYIQFLVNGECQLFHGSEEYDKLRWSHVNDELRVWYAESENVSLQDSFPYIAIPYLNNTVTNYQIRSISDKKIVLESSNIGQNTFSLVLQR